MATCEEIRFEGNYLYVRFGGDYTQLRSLENHAELIISACEKQACFTVLLDISNVRGMDGMSITEEHQLAKYASIKFPFPYRVIYIFPAQKKVIQQAPGQHFETAAKNRGVRVSVYYDYDEAVRSFTQERV